MTLYLPTYLTYLNSLNYVEINFYLYEGAMLLSLSINAIITTNIYLLHESTVKLQINFKLLILLHCYTIMIHSDLSSSDLIALILH